MIELTEEPVDLKRERFVGGYRVPGGAPMPNWLAQVAFQTV
jgi:hypothetical protein